MKLKKLLNKLNAYFNQSVEQTLQTDEGLSKVLKKLKKKELKLQEQLDQERNPEVREIIEQELKIVHRQRQKGIELLSELRNRQPEGG